LALFALSVGYALTIALELGSISYQPRLSWSSYTAGKAVIVHRALFCTRKRNEGSTCLYPDKKTLTQACTPRHPTFFPASGGLEDNSPSQHCSKQSFDRVEVQPQCARDAFARAQASSMELWGEEGSKDGDLPYNISQVSDGWRGSCASPLYEVIRDRKLLGGYVGLHVCVCTHHINAPVAE
jgi:hypothetical protein